MTAYNFGWSLGSGYGLYKENYNSDKYRKFNGSRAVFTNTDNSIHITESLDSSSFIETKNTQSVNAYSIKVTGLKPGIALEYRYVLPDVGGLKIIAIVEDGVYNLPQTGNSFNGFRFTGYLGACNIIIKQIPEYEGAIVTDGIDDYLKLDKVGYKVGTVIIKYKPVRLTNNWQYVLEAATDRTYITYNSVDGPIITNFDNYNTVGDYEVGIINTPRLIETPFYIGCKSNIKEFISMALYSIAIYQDVLTAEEIQKEINVMQYDTPNPVFALNFDNFAYKAVDYPEFATGKVTTNKIVVDSTTETFTGTIALAKDPEATTGDPIEVSAYKLKVTGIDSYNNPDGIWGIALMPTKINDENTGNWDSPIPIYKDGVYDIPAILKEDRVYNMGIVSQIVINKPIEIEILYDKNITKSFPETKQILP